MITGLSRKLRIVALFHRRIEGVAVDMRDRQRIEFRVTQEPRAAAARQRCPGRPDRAQAIAAKAVAWDS